MECIYLPRDAGPSWLLVALGAFVVAALSFCMLIPELIAPLETFANLPQAAAKFGGERWPLLVLTSIMYCMEVDSPAA